MNTEAETTSKTAARFPRGLLGLVSRVGDIPVLKIALWGSSFYFLICAAGEGAGVAAAMIYLSARLYGAIYD